MKNCGGRLLAADQTDYFKAGSALIELVLEDFGFGEVFEFGEVGGAAVEGVAWDEADDFGAFDVYAETLCFAVHSFVRRCHAGYLIIDEVH